MKTSKRAKPRKTGQGRRITVILQEDNWKVKVWNGPGRLPDHIYSVTQVPELVQLMAQFWGAEVEGITVKHDFLRGINFVDKEHTNDEGE